MRQRKLVVSQLSSERGGEEADGRRESESCLLRSSWAPDSAFLGINLSAGIE